MRTFLLWRARTPEVRIDPSAVGRELQRRFEPLFAPAPVRKQRSCGPVHLTWIELPVDGFHPPFLEEDGERWAFAPDYPINARRLLRSRGDRAAAAHPLLGLGAALERDPAAVMAELIPPASLIWSDGRSIRVATDGLGQSPLFEYQDDRIWALTNRVMALAALGLELRPVPEEWAARLTVGWFVGQDSGFANTRLVPGGVVIRPGEEGVERARFDPLSGWVHPPATERQACLEQARQSMLDHVSDAAELWRRPTLGLSGGWDSRAVASCLLKLGLPFEARVRGQETHFDVLISAQLARMAGFEHRVKTGGGVPPDTAEGLRQSVSQALLWQGGSFTLLKHKSFLARAGRDRLDGGVVNVMGQHAGIGKGDFAARIRAGDHPPERYEELLLDALMADAPPFLRADVAVQVRERLRTSYRKALDLDLTGRGPLHFFFLHEYTRRWGSATIASQTGLAVTPFLNPGFIRACYAYPEEELVRRPMHRFITGTNRPDWAAYPYTDQATEEDLLSGLIPPVEVPREEDDSGPRPRWRETRRHRRFHYKYYWKDVGKPLIKEALERGGFWTELFDPDQAREGWRDVKAGGDLLTVTYLLPEVLARG